MHVPQLASRAPAGRAWLAVAVLAALAAGCAAKPAWETARRWVAEQPAERLDVTGLTHRVALRWDLGSKEERQRWRLSGTGREAAHGLLFAPGEGRGWLVRPVDLATSAVDSFEIEAEGLTGGFVRVLWTHPGERFSPKRGVTVQLRPEDETPTVRVGDHPEWTGTIDRVRVEMSLDPSRRIVLREIRGRVEAATEREIQEAGSRFWRVELDHEVRSAMPVGTAGDTVWETDVPRRARLEFFYGGSVPPDGAQLVLTVDGDDRRLWSGRVGEVPGEGWRRSLVDLSGLAGSGRRLRFRLAADDTAGRHPWVYLAEPSLQVPAPYRPSLVLVIVDTLRADRVSLNGYQRLTTPALDEWFGRRGVDFSQVVAAAPWTLPSHISIFTGQDCLRHGFNYDLAAPPELTLLAERLRSAGYTTVAVTGGGYLHPDYGLDQGFESFRYWPARAPQLRELESGVGHALDALDTLADRPLFLLLHTYEVHAPFHAREPEYHRFAGEAASEKFADALRYRPVPASEEGGFVDVRRFHVRSADGNERPLTPEELPLVDALYDTGVAYTDSQLARLLQALDDKGLADRLVLVVTSDHGEALGERGLAAHAYLYDFNVKVPLMISAADGLGAGRRIDRQVRSVDLVPTLLELLDLPPAEGIDGRSLVGLMKDPTSDFPDEAWTYAAASGFGVALRLGGRLKYIFNNSVWPATRGSEELYDLRRDPAEADSLVASRGDELLAFRRRVARRLEDDPPGLEVTVTSSASVAQRIVVSPAVPARLKVVDMPPDVAVENLRTRQVAFDVPPRTRYGFRMEGLALDEVFEIESERGGESLCRRSIPLVELAASAGTTVDLSNCRTVDGGQQTPPVSMRLELSALPAGVSAAVDSRLEEQLRALGYLE